MEKVKLGILGMGTVASGLINIIDMNQSKIDEVLGKSICISKVLVNNINKKRNVNLALDIYTDNAYEVIDDENSQIIVELIGGINPAYEYIKRALSNKKHVVTANKALIATHGKELEELANENNVKLMYEASVAGGIPVLNTINENLVANKIDKIAGIINGTTNYILTQMSDNDLDYEQAVKQAQDLGFAEADPSSDVEGDDALYKIAILAKTAFGQRINIKDIPKEGITKISKEDMNYAKEFGYSIKLIASASREGEEIELRVHPTFVPVSHPLSRVKNEFNAVLLMGNAVGEIMLYGKGAGSLPTGSAVLGDVMSIIKDGNSFEHKVYENKYKVVNRAYKPYYIRLEVIDKPGVLGKIADVFGAHNISLGSVMQRQKNGNKEIAPLVFITHEVERKNIDAALEEIKKSPDVVRICSIIVVEEF